MQRRLAVRGRDLHGGVLPRGGRAADQERQVEPASLHLVGDVHHLVERRGDQAGEPDDVAPLLHGRVEDAVGGDHHPEVEHLVVVAAEDDADDVLADVVDVALDGGEHDLPARPPVPAGLLGLHVRLQVGDGALHRPRALHHLRQEHLPGAEEVADHGHPVHERPLDHVERTRQLLPGLLGVLLDEVDDPVDERVGQPLLDRGFAPGEVELALRPLTLHGGREGDQALGRVGTTVEDDVLDVLEEVGRDVLVDGELARVDDAHVEAGLDRVVEEDRVDRLAHDLVAAEGEGEVGDAAGDLGAGAALLDPRDGLDERLGEVGVLLHARGDREDVRVEDDVLGREADLVHEQPVGALADLHLAVGRIRLTLLVEGHDDDPGAVAADDGAPWRGSPRAPP